MGSSGPSGCSNLSGSSGLSDSPSSPSLPAFLAPRNPSNVNKEPLPPILHQRLYDISQTATQVHGSARGIVEILIDCVVDTVQETPVFTSTIRYSLSHPDYAQFFPLKQLVPIWQHIIFASNGGYPVCFNSSDTIFLNTLVDKTTLVQNSQSEWDESHHFKDNRSLTTMGQIIKETINAPGIPQYFYEIQHIAFPAEALFQNV